MTQFEIAFLTVAISAIVLLALLIMSRNFSSRSDLAQVTLAVSRLENAYQRTLGQLETGLADIREAHREMRESSREERLSTANLYGALDNRLREVERR